MGKKWTKKELKKEAKNYKTLREFRDNHKAAYNESKKRGILLRFVLI